MSEDGGGGRRTAVDRAATLVGDRWSLVVVDALLGGAARFSELERAVAGISPNVLSARLKQLEADGVVVAEPYQQRPVRHAYRLTDRGRSLADVLDLLAAWADDATAAPSHQRCGTTLTAVLWCPTCEEPVVGEGDDQLIHI